MNGPDVLSAFVILLAVLALAVLLVLVLRRLMPGLALPADTGTELRTLASRVLDPRHRAVLLRCRGRDYLLILSADGACLVDRLEGGEP